MTDDAREIDESWAKFCDAVEAAGVTFQFWVCPVLGHSEGTWRTQWTPTVEWRGDVAHCLAPDCNRTSANPEGSPTL